VNSFQELNFYSNVGVPFNDDRSYTISFSANTTTNNQVDIFENETHYVTPGINIVSVRSTPRDIIYSINVANATGATVTWTNPLPQGLVANTGGAGIFRVYGVNGPNVWNQIKAPLITMPGNFANIWTYTSTITYPNTANVTLSNTYSWTTNVNVVALSQLPVTTTQYWYPLVANAKISNTPQITALTYPGFVTENYTLTISPNVANIGNLSTTGVYGGTSTFYSDTGNLILTGNILAVNSRLGNLYYQPGQDPVWTANYALSNPASAYTSYCSQEIKSPTSTFSLTTPGDNYFSTNQVDTVQNAPAIVDPGTSGINTGNIILTITPNIVVGVANLSTTGNAGTTSTFNNTFKTIILEGNVSGINSHLANITYWPTDEYEDTFHLSYDLNPNGIFKSNVDQKNISITARHLTVPSGFVWDTNTIEYVTTAPQIRNTGITANYTMVIGSTTSNTISTMSTVGSGSSTFNGATEELTIVGNITQVNQHLANITLLPATDLANVDFNLKYTLTVPDGNVAIREQLASFGDYSVITSNLNISRSFITNTADQTIFANSTPQIVETIFPTPTYTIQLESIMGYFGNIGANTMSNVYTLSGSKETINSLWGNIKFYPKRDFLNGFPITVRQYRSATPGTNLQFERTVDLVGTPRTEPVVGAGTYAYTTTGNVSITPTYEQANYLTCRVLTVGKGGSSSSTAITGGGGGGGVADFTIGPGSNTTSVLWMKPAYITVNGTRAGTSGLGDTSWFEQIGSVLIYAGQGGSSTNGSSGGGSYSVPGKSGQGALVRKDENGIPGWTGYLNAVPGTAGFNLETIDGAETGFINGLYRWPATGSGGSGARGLPRGELGGNGLSIAGVGNLGFGGGGRWNGQPGAPGGGYGGGNGGGTVNTETGGAVFLIFYKD
jgi:hypothetical protein